LGTTLRVAECQLRLRRAGTGAARRLADCVQSGAFSCNSLHGCRVPLAFLAMNFDLINASYLPR
jgi:hypothetical protein